MFEKNQMWKTRQIRRYVLFMKRGGKKLAGLLSECHFLFTSRGKICWQRNKNAFHILLQPLLQNESPSPQRIEYMELTAYEGKVQGFDRALDL
jgi:hypothetical protein